MVVEVFFVDFDGDVFVFFGDCLLVDVDMFLVFFVEYWGFGVFVMLMMVLVDDFIGYGRVICDVDGGVDCVVE